MAKEESFTYKAKIIDCLPGANFKVKLEENNAIVNGTISGKIRKNNIKILMDDLVDIEISPYDLSKGRITFRYK
jgi:translation initiation factor IF-1